MDSLLSGIAETMDSNLNLIRQRIQEIITALGCREKELNAVQESVMERWKEIDMMKKSVEERVKEVEKKEEELKERGLIQESGLEDLELKSKEIEVREEKLNEKEKLMQGVLERMEVERQRFECIKKSIDGKQQILDEKLERHSKGSELKEKILSSREAELVAKEKELEGRERVLASRNDQIVLREKQLELRRLILDLTSAEKDGSIVLADYSGSIDFGLPPNAEQRLTRDSNISKRIMDKEKETGDKEFEATIEKQKILSPDEEEGLRERGLVIPKEEQLDSKVSLGDPNTSSAKERELKNLRQKSKKRGRPPTNQVELRILYMKTEPNADDSAQQGEILDSRINNSKRGRPSKNQVNIMSQCSQVSEFYDFDKDKKEILPGQTWACYDRIDGMPRIYVMIWQKNNHSLRGGVLVSDPTSKEKDTPIGCGKFVCEGSRIILNPSKFSHQMVSQSCSSGGYWIYPRKGEIWALFKEGEKAICCSSDSSQYKYEIVEVLTDFVKGTGIRVSFLQKITGYVSLFQQRTERATPYLIFPNRLFKFSHRIIACKMNGTEREGVPKGSFELDPAALPKNLC